VDLAKETIRFLARMNNTTNLYRRLQIFYHMFLTSAIATLFLASTHAPLVFSAACRAEFYMALELVRDLSARSWVSQRLWRTVRSLKAYAPRLGLLHDDEQQQHREEAGDAHARAAHTMAGMAAGETPAQYPGASPSPLTAGGFARPASLGPPQHVLIPSPGSLSTPSLGHHHLHQAQQHYHHPQQAPAAPQGEGSTSHVTEDQKNGLRLQTEMTRIFEGFTGINGYSPQGDSAAMAAPGQHPYANGEMTELMVDGQRVASTIADGGVYQQMRDMF